MPFRNPILGGDFLVRPAMMSPDFVSGVSGWAIRRDGSAEFNDVDVRGSVTVGPDPGAHVIVDSVTDSILMYDAGNNLIASVSPVNQTIGGITVRAGITVYSSTDPDVNIRLVGNQVQFRDLTTTPTATAGLATPNNLAGHGGQAGVAIISGAVGGAQAALQLLSESGDATQTAAVLAVQQNAAGVTRQGGIVQGDSATQPRMVHHQAVSGTTDASGFLTFNHGAGFTPTFLYCQVYDSGAAPAFGTMDVVDGTPGPTTAQVFCRNFDGTVRAGQAVHFQAQSWS